MNKNIIILISGNGSNMQSIVNANISNVNIVAIISNNSISTGLIWAKSKGLNTFCVNHRNFATKQLFEQKIISIIDSFNPKLIVLAGFKRILSEFFCTKYLNQIINIHPSILPAFTGLNTHERAIKQGCKITGCTVHFVTSELDKGPIIAQVAVPILQNDNVKTLNARVLKYEHEIYPKVINDLINENIILKNGKVFNKRLFNYNGEAIVSYD